MQTINITSRDTYTTIIRWYRKHRYLGNTPKWAMPEEGVSFIFSTWYRQTYAFEVERNTKRKTPILSYAELFEDGRKEPVNSKRFSGFLGYIPSVSYSKEPEPDIEDEEFVSLLKRYITEAKNDETI